jgi:hypothetical protein
MKRCWILQTNPDIFDIDGALEQLSKIWWRVPQYTGEISRGDNVLIWRSGGAAGFVAIGKVLTDPQLRAVDELEYPLYLASLDELAVTTRVLIEVSPIPFVSKEALRSLEAFNRHRIIVAPMGTVFPMSASDLMELAPFIPRFTDTESAPRDTLPRPFAWEHRAKGVLPLPGGYDGYLISLSHLCEMITDERPAAIDFAKRIEALWNVQPAAARLRTSFLRKTGILSEQGGVVSLTDWASEWFRTRDSKLVIALLHSRCRFIGEMLSLTVSARSNEELLSLANANFHMNWDTQTQIANRRGWLQSAGMLIALDDGRVQITESGRALLNEIEVFDPTDKSTTDEIEDTGVIDEDDFYIFEPSVTADTLVQRLENASVDSANPDQFERLIRDAFEFLGFNAEWLGGSGRTDVLCDASLGPDSYRVIIDGKTSASGSVAEAQIDWVTLGEHRVKHEANYVGLVAPNPTGTRLFDRARDHNVTVISASQLSGLLKQHSKSPVGVDVYRHLFERGGSVDTAVVDEKADAYSRMLHLTTAICKLIVDRTTDFGRLSARDLYLLLSGSASLSDVTEHEIQVLLDALASSLLNFVEGSPASGYRSTTTFEVLRRRLNLIAQATTVADHSLPGS